MLVTVDYDSYILFGDDGQLIFVMDTNENTEVDDGEMFILDSKNKEIDGGGVIVTAIDNNASYLFWYDNQKDLYSFVINFDDDDTSFLMYYEPEENPESLFGVDVSN